MKPEEFVEMAAGLLTSRENAADGSPLTPEATLDSMIGVARNIAAQALASADGLTVTELFDVLGCGIMSCKKGAIVVVRHRGAEARVDSVDVREDAVVLGIKDVAEEEKLA